jgi:hypothetical protein
MGFHFDMVINNVTVGSVDLQGAGAGNRTFVFTPTGGSAQAAQTVSITVNGNSRSLSSVAPFSIDIPGVTGTPFTSLSGTVDLSTHTGSGTVSNSNQDGERTSQPWTTSDASSSGGSDDVPEVVVPRAAATAAGQYGSGGKS